MPADRDRLLVHLEDRLRTLGLLSAARQVKRAVQLLVSPSFRRRERAHRRRFRQFEHAYGGLLRQHLNGASTRHRRALVCTSSLWTEIHVGLIKALELAGFEPVVVIMDVHEQGLLRDYYALAGVRLMHAWGDFAGRPDFRAADALLARCRSLEELLALERDGIRLGRFVFSTVLRWERRGSVDWASTAARRGLVTHLTRSLDAAATARRMLDAIRPDLVWLVDGVYTPEGELFDACLAAGLDTITWALGHKSNTLMLKRYTTATRGQHPKSLSAESWALVRQMPWTEVHRQRLHEELYDSYASGDWQSHIGTQVNKRLAAAEEVRRELGLDPAKKTAVIFPHILWDASLSWGQDLFRGYEEWLIETVRAASQNPAVNWILKIHPANVGKNVLEGVRAEPAELVVLRRHIGPLPPHVHLLPAEHPLSTFSLYGVMDYCVTVRGTVGIEAGRLGIPTITGGTGRYSGKGFTVDSATREEYLARLARIQDLPRLTPAQQELAERFAYGTFLLRPLRLTTVVSAAPATVARVEDVKRAQVRIVGTTPNELAEAPDLRAFARWVADGKQTDFIMPQELTAHVAQ